MLTSLNSTARNHALSSSARSILVFAIIIAAWCFNRRGPSFPWAAIVLLSLGLPTLIILTLPLERIADIIVRHVHTQPPTNQFRNIAQEIAIALNQPVESIQTNKSPIPNIAMLPCSRQHVIIATTGALEKLTRYELQALVAAQFAGMRDKWCRLATRAEILWWALPWVCPLTFLALFLDRPAAIFASFASIFIYLFCPRWNEQARDLCADVAAIRTTFDPQSLGNAMRKLAEQAGRASRIRFTAWYLPCNPFLVIPKRIQSTTTVSGKTTRSWSSSRRSSPRTSTSCRPRRSSRQRCRSQEIYWARIPSSLESSWKRRKRSLKDLGRFSKVCLFIEYF